MPFGFRPKLLLLPTTMRLKTIAAFVAATVGVQAQVQINEIFINPPGTDSGMEFIEFKGAANQSLAGLHLLMIEGDGSSIGIIDVALDLGSLSLGSNGLLLWRDSSTVLTPAPASGTAVHVADFNPDIENGSNTYVIVSGFSGTAGVTDLDTNNDGVLDSTPWTSVVNAIGLVENDGASNVSYAVALGGISYGPNAGFNADALVRLANDANILFGGDVTGSSPGSFPFTEATTAFSSGSFTFGDIVGTAQLTPGSENFSAVPEPQEYAAIAGVLALGAAVWRRRANRA
jgi:hypothetical protein